MKKQGSRDGPDGSKDPLNLSGARPHSQWAPTPLGGWEGGLIAGLCSWIARQFSKRRNERN